MTRLPSLRPPIAFAHRGAKAHAPENTLESFVLARRLGATGIETDAWRTADGVVVLDHDGVVGRRPRRRSIDEVDRQDLPSHIPSLAEYYFEVGVDLQLSIDVKDPAAAPELIAVAHECGAASRLWLCHPDRELVASWRAHSDEVHLVESTRLSAFDGSPEAHVATSAAMGIEVINLHHSEWTGGTIAMVHRFGLLCFGWDAQHDRILDGLLDAGIDGVYCDHVDRMMEAFDRAGLDANRSV